MATRDEVSRELDRVVDRLTTMPLTKAQGAVEQCHQAASFIVEHTPGIPDGAVLPEVGASALGAQLAVVGRDFLDAVGDDDGAVLTDVVDVLVGLRRSLP